MFVLLSWKMKGRRNKMTWRLTGTYYLPCSCNVGCPCNFGELEADRDWCSAALALDIRNGDVDGTDVSGTKAAFAVDFPVSFLAGNGTGRQYFDPNISEEQRSALEPVFRGERGGVFEVLGALVPDFLPSKEAAINIQTGEEATRIKVGDFGALVVTPLRDQEGNITTVRHAPAAMVEEQVMAKGTGSSWRDPEMREWTSGGHAEQGDFDWSA
jgi:hypothetical protein